MRNRPNFNILPVIVLIVLALGLGYAFLTVSLNINGTVNVDKNTWDIHLENVQIEYGFESANIPTISTDKTTVTYNVHLTKPGEFYEFTVDVRNSGSIDGMVDSVISKVNNQSISNLPSSIDYYATYIDETEIESNQLLTADSVDTFVVHIGYKSNIDSSELLSSAQSLNLSLQVVYVQATSSAYSRSNNYIYELVNQQSIGEAPNINEFTETDYNALIECHPFFIRMKIVNNIIKEKNVGFVLNGKDYYLREKFFVSGSNNPPEYDPLIYYERNKHMLDDAFGTNNCNEQYNYNDDAFEYRCTKSGLTAYTRTDGINYITDSEWYCSNPSYDYSVCTHLFGAGNNCYSGS